MKKVCQCGEKLIVKIEIDKQGKFRVTRCPKYVSKMGIRDFLRAMLDEAWFRENIKHYSLCEEITN